MQSFRTVLHRKCQDIAGQYNFRTYTDMPYQRLRTLRKYVMRWWCRN